MMRTMRSIAPWIMLIVAVSFVGWMVFEVGMDATGQGGATVNDKILSINGEGVGVQEFYLAVRATQDQQRQAGAPPIFNLEDQRALEDAVVEQIVQQVLLAAEYDRRGIMVTDEEIRNALLNRPLPALLDIPEFQTDGVFDITKYQAYLMSGADPQFAYNMELQYREQLPLAKFVNQVTADVFVSTERLLQIYHDRNDSVTVNVVALVPAVQIADAEVEPTDEEIEAYYRANRTDFERPARAFMSYIEVLSGTNGADTAAALQRAEELREEILAGTDFAAVAARESSDSVSRVDGGDLGMQAFGSFVPAFEEAALALSQDELSGPVQTQFGYHLIRLESKTADSLHARHILVPIELAGDHLDAVDSRADTLDLLAAESDDPWALDSAAAGLGVPVMQASPVFEGDRAMTLGVFVPDAGIWAFEAIEGQTSPVVEATWAYMVFRLDSLQKTGIAPLEEVRFQVAAAVRQEKKAERIRALADAFAADLAAGLTLDDATQKHSLAMQSVGPFTRLAPSPVLRGAATTVGAAFGLPLNTVGGPYEDEFGTFFIEPTEHTVADTAGFGEQLDALRLEIAQAIQQARIQFIVATLREDADVIDRRQELQLAAQQQPELPFGATSPLGF